VLGFFPVILACEGVQAAEPLGRDALGYMAEGAAANREAFTQFRCKFRVTRAKAATYQDALEGKITEPIRLHGLWLVDGAKYRYQLDCEPEVMQADLARFEKFSKERVGKKRDAPPGQYMQGPRIDCDQRLVLKYGEYALSHGRAAHGVANVYAEGMRKPDLRVTPFAMNVMGPDEFFSPATLLRTSLEGKGPYTARYDGTEKVRGVETMVATVTYVEGGYWKLYLDPRRGFLPVRFLETGRRDNKVYQQAETLEMRGCSGGRWYPVRSVVVFDPAGPPPLRVEVYDTLEFDADQAPADAEFHVDIPAKTEVNTTGLERKGPWWYMTTSAERVHGKDLPQVFQRIVDSGEKQLAERGRTEGRQPIPSTPSRGRLTFLVACAIAILAIGVGLVVLRARWKRAQRKGRPAV
jgi:hypothetical protein